MTTENENTPAKGKISIAAVIVGWVVIEVVAFVVGLFTGILVDDSETAGYILLFAAGPLGALIGGYVAASMGKVRKSTHGVLAAAISMLLAIALASTQTGDFEVLFDPIRLASWALLLVSGAIGASLVRSAA